MKEIYEEYGKMIYSTALNICKNTQTAEDVTSEFFLKLKKAASVYRSGLGHKKWLIVSVRNLTIDFIRKQNREIPFYSETDNEENHPFSDIPDNADTEESVTSQMSAEQLLDHLDKSYREIIYLKVYCSFTLAEISDILNIPAGTVAWRYRTAVNRLKKVYKEVQ